MSRVSRCVYVRLLKDVIHCCSVMRRPKFDSSLNFFCHRQLYFLFSSLAAAKQLSLVMNEWEKLCLCHCSRSGLNAVLFRYNPNMRRPITFVAISEGNISRTERGSAARSRHWQLGFNPLYFRVSVSLKYYISLKYSMSLVHFSWEEDFIGSPGGLAEEEEQVLRLQKEVQGWRSSQGGL